MNQARSKLIPGFTIVELLVVIVVIGVLAAVTIVAYSGVSNKASIAGVQSDLTNSSKQIKIFQVTNGNNPATVSTDCVAQPDTTTNKCLKLSNGNQIDYYIVNNSSNPQTFTLVIKDKNGNNKYQITQDSAPTIASSSPIFTTGGTINPTSGTRTHTFGPGTYNLTTAASGTINIDLKGSGGGGGSRCGGVDGSDGNSTYITWQSNSYTALYGFGGDGFADCSSTIVYPGSASVPGGFTNTASPIIGGGALGGEGDDDTTHAKGGNGGRVTGSISVLSGQSVLVVVGLGGAGVPGAQDGQDGIAIISYLY